MFDHKRTNTCYVYKGLPEKMTSGDNLDPNPGGSLYFYTLMTNLKTKDTLAFTYFMSHLAKHTCVSVRVRVCIHLNSQSSGGWWLMEFVSNSNFAAFIISC